MKRFLIIFSLALLPLLSFATSQTTITEGTQYKAVDLTPSTPSRLTVPKGKILVVEFFSYGCPWCFKLEPSLEAWLKTKPKNVVFERIPVMFEQGWDVYAKAYYTAEALGVLNKITPDLFNAIHVKNKDLTSESAMQAFFASEGVSKKEFESAFDFSPGIGMELQRSNSLMMGYKVFVVPTVIVNGKYYTNPALVNGDDQLMMQVIQYLVDKESSGNVK